MFQNKLDFSVIIPHRNSLSTLSKLFSTIPEQSNIEILLIDNSENPINKDLIGINRDYELLYSDPCKGAGGARNKGIECAKGKWLLFADADDFFSENAFKIFEKYIASEAEIVYFGMGGVYSDSGAVSDRGDVFTKLAKDYCINPCRETEDRLRLQWDSPCAKMVKSDLVKRINAKFDEVVASNDVYFSLLTGYNSHQVVADEDIVYVATVIKGSLTKRRDYDVIKSRFLVTLRYNAYVKYKGLSKYQRSVMYYFYESVRLGPKVFMEFLHETMKYKQNPLIGSENWIKTFVRVFRKNKKDKKYITY